MFFIERPTADFVSVSMSSKEVRKVNIHSTVHRIVNIKNAMILNQRKISANIGLRHTYRCEKHRIMCFAVLKQSRLTDRIPITKYHTYRKVARENSCSCQNI